VTPLYPSKLALASLTGGGRSVGLDPHGLLRQGLLLCNLRQFDRVLRLKAAEIVVEFHMCFVPQNHSRFTLLWFVVAAEISVHVTGRLSVLYLTLLRDA
jgi:hypothetical protein